MRETIMEALEEKEWREALRHFVGDKRDNSVRAKWWHIFFSINIPTLIVLMVALYVFIGLFWLPALLWVLWVVLQ